MTLIAICFTTVHRLFRALLPLGLLLALNVALPVHSPALAQSVKSLAGQCKVDYASWKKRAGYAAFAISRDGKCGWSFYFDSAAEARKQALAGCKRKSCKIVEEIAPTKGWAASKAACDRGFGQKRIDACTWLIETAKATGFELAWALNERGEAKYYTRGDDGPIADYTASIAADQSYARPYFNRGILLRRQSKLVEALADLETAIRKFKPQGCQALCDFRNVALVAVHEIKQRMERIRSADDRTLCLWALTASKISWDQTQPSVVSEIQKRGLTVADCRVEQGYRPQLNPYESRPVKSVCADALDAQRLNWEANRLHATDEAKRRGETIDSCRAKLRLAPLPPEENSVVAGDAEPTFIVEEVEKPPVAAAVREKRIALVIGNADYVMGALPNPSNDARAMAAALRGLGFEVIEGENLGRAEMQHKVVAFEDKARDAHIALFFYAGHAVQLQDRNYLIPLDATIEGETALRFESVELDLVAATMTDGGAAGIILLDACRDNPFKNKLNATRGLAVGDGLAAPSFLSAGLLYGFATTPGEVALDGKGEHSPFTAALLKHLPSKGLEIEQVLKDVSIDVAETTGGRQIPWRNTNLRTKLYLNP